MIATRCALLVTVVFMQTVAEEALAPLLQFTGADAADIPALAESRSSKRLSLNGLSSVAPGVAPTPASEDRCLQRDCLGSLSRAVAEARARPSDKDGVAALHREELRGGANDGTARAPPGQSSSRCSLCMIRCTKGVSKRDAAPMKSRPENSA